MMKLRKRTSDVWLLLIKNLVKLSLFVTETFTISKLAPLYLLDDDVA